MSDDDFDIKKCAKMRDRLITWAFPDPERCQAVMSAAEFLEDIVAATVKNPDGTMEDWLDAAYAESARKSKEAVMH